MKIAILLLVAFTATASSAFIGSDKCMYGPSYWCATYQHAADCDAIEHCKQNVWVQGENCTICKMVVEKIKDVLEDNAIQTEVKSFIDEICTKEGGFFAGECKALVNQYLPAIIADLDKLVQDPQQVCAKLGLCPSTDEKLIMEKLLIQVMRKHNILKSDDQESCAVCEMVVDKVRAVLANNAIQKQVQAVLDEMCTKDFGPFAAQCKTMVDQYLPIIVAHVEILLQDSHKACTALGLCSATDTNLVMEKLLHQVMQNLPLPSLPRTTQVDQESCTLCKMIVDKLRDVLEDNAMQQQVQAFLDQLCTKEFGPLATECKAAVDKYFPIIISHITKLVQNSQQVCTALGLCTAKVPVHQPRVKAGPQCVICEFVMTEVKKMLSNDATQKEIEAALHTVCNIMPANVKTQCNTFVNTYAPMIIELIISEDPKSVCSLLGLCTGEAADKLRHLVAMHHKSSLDPMCALGASYWCRSPALAQKCNAYPYCRTFVWRQ